MLSQQQRMLSIPPNQLWNGPMSFGMNRMPPMPNFPGAPGPFQPMNMMNAMRGGMRPPNRIVRPPLFQGGPGFAPFAGVPRYTQPASGARRTVEGMSSTDLSKMSPEEQKNALGERLYVKIQEINPGQAAKITGMLLEMDTPEILNVLEDSNILNQKVTEAIAVLRQHTEKAE